MPQVEETRDCYRCGKKGHLQANCPEIVKKEEIETHAQFFVAVKREMSTSPALSARARAPPTVGPRGPVPALRDASQREQQQQEQDATAAAPAAAPEHDAPAAPNFGELMQLHQGLVELENGPIELRHMVTETKQRVENILAFREDRKIERTIIKEEES
ncbi:C2HC-type zinc finger protein [Aspergillus aculeatinus CBS 121060]|uniref:Uncharacterized protein n=1 Tax=Aspergillus aculeatinus CBS 121060 TaxID=1448322 RepID=A0ACD1H809_9EURO|nr:hypothetical protein BO66DRAFT_438970 [Aspergillus aculeatinus CBS 121060]RAH69549.1 hypothetical protein BO66DRAFT_438970 [Aspergillus aculeatinus CBS 121060]